MWGCQRGGASLETAEKGTARTRDDFGNSPGLLHPQGHHVGELNCYNTHTHTRMYTSTQARTHTYLTPILLHFEPAEFGGCGEKQATKLF